ncbi:hypothetical protein PHYBLDRAFT_140913 [Phycomyces blakesleeanus NRRL 1555(-)]|uniref:Uncharacterized protein n=1 Tax=Phycomyces blakesleeanus (strain ATCC 8743b / DSM 1359 / FGSC 10004 / NBRC 33097 / NRRL 1555) TaxID=763407 RepID=A0A162UYS9_PHYB8|nr:hypothetical protein PHYBLDRAFT_140913 [Phycomyces blakesleeanus NRRL 1555(-)]OAD78862.1 hypothetical protein PHYBLDRAFT_140913 [Phycomyces blakesleeanus NRRL 1555(-)]|eukprot:XP_018296902.1 hypothetical protein PHYBLDRAFT_140913 [Phycomyces blakesleeanus NRRL 1555(-)]
MSTVNITPMNENIYTLATISEALECSSIPGVMTLRLNNTIRTICNSNKRRTDITAEEAKNSGIKMCFSQKYSCHCSGTYESKTEMRVVQKRAKKNKCPALLCVREFFKTPEWYEITLTKDHADHTPEQSSKSASQIRIDMLRTIDRYGRSSDCKVNYYNIWNLMNKNQMISFMIWINEKLAAMNFSIFKTNTSYSPSLNLFTCGFMSPIQQNKMKNAVSFCLDATYGISGKIDEILYTLLIHNEEIGRGWPVAYMITNDRDVGPIVQWLQFLTSSLLLVNPKQITIDCCLAKVHAIQTTFFTTQIQFCIFHITQAWNRKLSDSVKISGSLLSEARLLHDKMMKSLQEIKNWCTENKFKLWSRAYFECQFSHMFTNNYIESWHNQLKTVFMKRFRNKRLDKLIFIFVHNVEYYLSQKYDRVMSNNEAMSAFTRE